MRYEAEQFELPRLSIISLKPCEQRESISLGFSFKERIPMFRTRYYQKTMHLPGCMIGKWEVVDSIHRP